MAVAGDDHGTRPGVTLLDHDLVTDTTSGWIEVDRILLCELLNVGVLSEVLLRLILNVVVERKDWLRWAMDLGELERVVPGKK